MGTISFVSNSVTIVLQLALSIDYAVIFCNRCIITESANKGYVTAKKDGAGGIVGYMKHGIVSNCEGYGGVESTEGDYVGGIAGQSLTVINNCYALDCFCRCLHRKKGCDRGAEPISYNELLTVEYLPTAFWHLKVTYRIEDTYLGTQEMKVGESLANLNYPNIPVKEGYYGVWPDYSDRVMTCNLIIDGFYMDTVAVVESSEKIDSATESWQKPYALVEQTFTKDTLLNASLSDQTPRKRKLCGQAPEPIRRTCTGLGIPERKLDQTGQQDKRPISAGRNDGRQRGLLYCRRKKQCTAYYCLDSDRRSSFTIDCTFYKTDS